MSINEDPGIPRLSKRTSCRTRPSGGAPAAATSILSQVQTVFAGLGIPVRSCVISGIGCSSRFPYYMNTYGFHTIHGRAPLATGVKLANPDLSVWVHHRRR